MMDTESSIKAVAEDETEDSATPDNGAALRTFPSASDVAADSPLTGITTDNAACAEDDDSATPAKNSRFQGRTGLAPPYPRREERLGSASTADALLSDVASPDGCHTTRREPTTVHDPDAVPRMDPGAAGSDDPNPPATIAPVSGSPSPRPTLDIRPACPCVQRRTRSKAQCPMRPATNPQPTEPCRRRRRRCKYQRRDR